MVVYMEVSAGGILINPCLNSEGHIKKSDIHESWRKWAGTAPRKSTITSEDHMYSYINSHVNTEQTGQINGTPIFHSWQISYKLDFCYNYSSSLLLLFLVSHWCWHWATHTYRHHETVPSDQTQNTARSQRNATCSTTVLLWLMEFSG